jgi:hypothetical protein
MIKVLRKRHLQIWTALAVLVPVGIIAAWIFVPRYPVQPLLQPVTENALPEIVKQTDKGKYMISIRTNPQRTAYQLEWINNNTLAWPTATIYLVAKESTDIKNGLLIGRIESRGAYRFALPPNFQPVNFSTYQLTLYDFIHERIIDTINF